MKKIIITGGAGFMGVNFANHYLNKGHEVVIFDNLSRKGCLENLTWLKQNPHASNLKVVVGDVRFPPSALSEHVETADALFHFAAQVAVTTSVADPWHDFEVNAQGTLRTLELIRASQGKKPALFYASTNKVYGGIETLEIVEQVDRYAYKDVPQGIAEDRSLDFHSPYGCSKGCADQYVRDYARIYDLDTVVFRQSCIYGYRQFGIEDQGWVAWFTIAAVLGKPFTIFGDGKQVRDILFITDLINAYDTAWQQLEATRCRVYNIGGGPQNAVSLLNLIDFLSEELGVSLSPTFAEWRPGDQRVYVSNIAKAKEEFGWEPKTDWRSGVRNLLDWTVSNRAILQELF